MLFSIVVAAALLLCSDAQKLQKYNINPNKVTVSGISAGSAMATQFHVAYSNLVKGSGNVAGPPYMCANGNLMTATTTCMNGLMGVINLPFNNMQQWYLQGNIDNPANLVSQRAYVFSGGNDFVVNRKVVQKTQDFYENFMGKTSGLVKTVYNIPAVHGFITDSFGGSCSITSSNYINNCNYNQAYEILKHLYPQDNIQQPVKGAAATGKLLKFDQTDFFPAGSSAKSLSLDTQGYVYVPTQCEAGKLCKLHIAFHGCAQQAAKIGTDFVANAGYNQCADLNDVIVLYPQTVASMMAPQNPNACFDWWGYTGPNYGNNKGQQMRTVKAMVDFMMN